MDVRNPKTFVRSLPIWVWSNKFYQLIAPETFKKMTKVNHEMHIAGLEGPNQLVLNFSNVKLHNDPGDTGPALLAYYHGPFT